MNRRAPTPVPGPANDPVGDRSATRVGSQRRVGRGAAWAFLPVLSMLPFSLLALVIIWLPLGLTTSIPFWWIAFAFIATGPLLFVRPFQVAVLTPILGARAPTAAEAETIRPLWNEVIHAAGQQGVPAGARYVVRIMPSDELNAFACGGHLVVVTSFAIRRLPTDELRGVLAHELGHHLGLHTVATTLIHWLSAPVVMFARFGFFLERVAVASAQSFGRKHSIVEAFSRTGATLMHWFGLLFSSSLRAADALTNLVGHDAEFEADRQAVSMGFGKELSAALRRLAADDGVRRRGWRARLAASHPPARTRVARIDALRRRPSA